VNIRFPPRSACWDDGEELAARNHEVIQMARMPDLGTSRLEGGLGHDSWVVGVQLKPGTQTRLVIGCIVGELDTEMSPTGKADNEHRLIDARKLNGPYRTAQDRLEALSQFPATMRAREDMHVAAESDHDVAGPFSPVRSVSWCASSAVVLDRCAGDLRRVRRGGLDRLLRRCGGSFPVVRDPAVPADHPGRIRRTGGAPARLDTRRVTVLRPNRGSISRRQRLIGCSAGVLDSLLRHPAWLTLVRESPGAGDRIEGLAEVVGRGAAAVTVSDRQLGWPVQRASEGPLSDLPSWSCGFCSRRLLRRSWPAAGLPGQVPSSSVVFRTWRESRRRSC